MGRLIGDGGCFAQITDIAVHPDHQRQGLGTQVMAALMGWAEANLPKGCYISLIADPGAENLYAKFGFTERYGMARYLR
jgi:GNAT superfamily N-acetyltransferase